MNTNLWILAAAVAVVVLLALIAVGVFKQRGTDRLRKKFGPEYDRVVDDGPGRDAAEAGLREREKRVAASAVHPLTTADRDRYIVTWGEVQTRFVDDPAKAVSEADRLLGQVMSTRGYPTGDFEQRSGDISVDHPMVVANYREAHRLASPPEGAVPGTEDLRRAMILFRGLFDELVGAPAFAGPATGATAI